MPGGPRRFPAGLWRSPGTPRRFPGNLRRFPRTPRRPPEVPSHSPEIPGGFPEVADILVAATVFNDSSRLVYAFSDILKIVLAPATFLGHAPLLVCL